LTLRSPHRYDAEGVSRGAFKNSIVSREDETFWSHADSNLWPSASGCDVLRLNIHNLKKDGVRVHFGQHEMHESIIMWLSKAERRLSRRRQKMNTFGPTRIRTADLMVVDVMSFVWDFMI